MLKYFKVKFVINQTAQRLKKMLAILDVDPDNLSTEGQLNMKSLVQSSMELDVSKPSLECCVEAATILQENIYQAQTDHKCFEEQKCQLEKEKGNLEEMRDFITELVCSCDCSFAFIGRVF